MNKPIGGFFELELRNGTPYHKNGILLNSGRHCLEYLIIIKEIRELFIPLYSCDVILEPCIRNNVKVNYYIINKRLEIDDIATFPQNSYVLYSNYFGIKDDYIKGLSKQLPHLIVDNAQAFFCAPLCGIDTFYSPRKFFGVPDGGILFSETKRQFHFKSTTSRDKTTHLLMRSEGLLEKAYAEFQKNEKKLSTEPLQYMSKLTKSLLENIDYKHIRKKRLTNFKYLHKILGDLNLLGNVIDKGSFEVPMVYPFMVKNNDLRKKLIENKIYVAKYWPNVSEHATKNTIEVALAENIVPLPIDQRYGEEEMNYILGIIKKYV